MSSQAYAVVADERLMASFLGDGSTSRIGVCIVRGNQAECRIIESREELPVLLGNIPACPSGFADETALPGFDAEMEALALIADEAAALSGNLEDRFPDGFSRGFPRSEGGLAVRTTPYGLDARFSPGLARSLGWLEGDRISLGVTACGNLLSFTRSSSGAVLVRSMDEPDVLQPEHDLFGVPLGMELGESPWKWPHYEMRERSVVISPFSIQQAENPVSAGVSDEPQAGLPSGEGVRLPFHTVLVVAGLSASAGFLSAVLWV